MAKAKLNKQVKVDLPTGDEKPPRTFTDVQNEFSAVCAKTGHLSYQVFTLQKDIDLLNEQMRNLNFEAAAIKTKESEAAKAATQAQAQ